MQLHRLVNLAGAHSLRSKPKGEDSFGTNALPRRTIETHGDRAKDSAHYVPQRGKRCDSRGQVRPRCQADDGAETPRNVLWSTLDTSREEIKQVLSMTRPSPTFDARILEALVIPVHFVMGKGHERQSQR